MTTVDEGHRLDQPLGYWSGSQFRLRSQLERAAAGFGVAAVMACFLVALLELTPEQWRWLLIITGFYVLACAALTRFTLARVDGPIRDALEADAGDSRPFRGRE